MNKPFRNETLRRLERIRRRIPYVVWLFYDVVFGSLLVYGLHFSPWFWAGFPFLAMAVFFDVVEFIVKATEDKLFRRFMEGTGDPTPRTPPHNVPGIHYHDEPLPPPRYGPGDGSQQ